MCNNGKNFLKPTDVEFGPSDLAPLDIVATNSDAYTYYAWDEEENVVTATTSGFTYCGTGGNNPPHQFDACPNLFPLVVQEVDINQFLTPDEFGWILFVWPASNYEGSEFAPPTPDYYQTWMGARHSNESHHADFLPGMPVANFNCFSDQVLPKLGFDIPESR